MKQTLVGVGVMTGTSLDGIDVAVCKFSVEEPYRYEILEAETLPFSDVWRDRLLCLGEQSAEVYAKTHVYFSHYLGKEIADFLQKKELKPDFVAVHGQTIFHQPDKNFTAQIGDGETLVTYFDCLLVCNFRNKDVALGGQGAPLVPIGEKYLFPEQKLFLNLGGIANITHKEIAFDISPCNLVLNFLAKKQDENLQYDRGGEIAKTGLLQEDLFQKLNANAYFSQRPPKSLGWEFVSEQVLPVLGESGLNIPDILRTYVEHVAFQLGEAVRRMGIQNEKLLITGGGRHNDFLIERMQEHLSPYKVSIHTPQDTRIIDFKEAILFAFLGLRTLTGKPTVIKGVTGAKCAAVTGSIHLPAAGWKGSLFR